MHLAQQPGKIAPKLFLSHQGHYYSNSAWYWNSNRCRFFCHLVSSGNEIFPFDIVEVKPGNAVSIVETDMNVGHAFLSSNLRLLWIRCSCYLIVQVDFAPPLDQDEWDRKVFVRLAICGLLIVIH